MTEFCPLPLDTVTKRRFWESLDNRSRSLLSDKPDVLEAIFDSVRVHESGIVQTAGRGSGNAGNGGAYEQE